MRWDIVVTTRAFDVLLDMMFTSSPKASGRAARGPFPETAYSDALDT